MRIYEYDEVDPLEVLHLNLLCLDFALTPERVALMRRLDPRPFPFLGVYAQEQGRVVGQVGVFRLPVVSGAGATEVGGVWAVSTHPAFARRGIATRLLEEAHARMRSVGLRFSTLGTQRDRVAHALYRRLGYIDVCAAAGAIARQELLAKPSDVRAERIGVGRVALADRLFEQIAGLYLGFARRHHPFFPALDAQGALQGHELWLLWRGAEAVGYAVALSAKPVLRIRSLLVTDWVDPAAAAAAVAQEAGATYVLVRVDRRDHRAAFLRAGFLLADQDWDTFMVKPLTTDADVAQFHRLYGIETGRFLMSYLDVT